MPAPSREAFSYRHHVDIRFRDVDVGGHAHHSQALVYFEEARTGYWSEVVGRSDPADVEYVLAEARVRYHGRIFYPTRLEVGVRVALLAKKHFEMRYGAWTTDDELVVSGQTVQVMYDYDEGTSIRIPPEVRRSIDAVDGPFDDRGGRRGD